MNITVNVQGFDRSTAIDSFVRSEVQAAMDRFTDSILAVDVFMKDTNGPKGGIDKQVLMRIHMRSGQQLASQTERADLYAAISATAKRAKRVVRRSLRKARRVQKMRMQGLIADAPI